jgi:hypothetical protein
MSKSIKLRTAALAEKNDAANLKVLLDAALADLTALRTAFNTAMTKLNADAGVTDTNYAAAPALTLIS